MLRHDHPRRVGQVLLGLEVGLPVTAYEPIATPEAVAASVTAYLERFGLAFGCFDFTVDTAGHWWFLECGANAQWGWIEHETGLPVADAIARQLTGDST
ncbi:MAG: hypothetical protein ACRDSE_10020 [Pseudonocardiaceae bacterium]